MKRFPSTKTGYFYKKKFELLNEDILIKTFPKTKRGYFKGKVPRIKRGFL